MSYVKAKNILPAKLLRELQNHIEGQYLYIPLKTGSKKPWGAITKSKILTEERNKEIFRSYQKGVSVEKLSQQYFLSDKAVYKIIAKIKYNR
ncbi:Mor family transcriptional regulator [Elusimicrobium simillimum]|uniref:CD3324 family protein n=1 Tax=Elusimicrobium simillimum TaxID=3143438 RepID=UPI003C705A11